MRLTRRGQAVVRRPWIAVGVLVLGVPISILAGVAANLVPTLLPAINNGYGVGGLLILLTLVSVALLLRQSSGRPVPGENSEIEAQPKAPGNAVAPSVNQRIYRPSGPVIGAITDSDIKFIDRGMPGSSSDVDRG